MIKTMLQCEVYLYVWFVLFAHFFLGGGLTVSAAQSELKPTRWEKDIAKFEEADRQNPPPQNAVLFVGSSSIYLWNLKESFPTWKTINRGFGGSYIEDSVYYADRIINPYHPRIIVFYAGDNDIAGGKSPQQVLLDYQTLVKKIQTALPKTVILYISIKPSILRWHLVDPMREANRLIQEFTKTNTQLIFVDMFPAMLDTENKPRKELFLKDGLHLNAQGYKLWNSILEPYLSKLMSASLEPTLERPVQ